MAALAYRAMHVAFQRDEDALRIGAGIDQVAGDDADHDLRPAQERRRLAEGDRNGVEQCRDQADVPQPPARSSVDGDGDMSIGSRPPFVDLCRTEEVSGRAGAEEHGNASEPDTGESTGGKK